MPYQISLLLNEVKPSHEKTGNVISFMFSSDSFQTTLAYLVDSFQAKNCIKLKLQGRNQYIMNSYNISKIFIAKLRLWRRPFKSGNLVSYLQLDNALKDEKIII